MNLRARWRKGSTLNQNQICRQKLARACRRGLRENARNDDGLLLFATKVRLAMLYSATDSQSKSTSNRNASLDLFRDLLPYRGRLVSNKGGLPSFAHEVTLINNLLFARFMDATNPAHDSVPSRQSDNSAWCVDQDSLTRLTQEILPRYSWSLQQNGNAEPQASSSVRPWLLD